MSNENDKPFHAPAWMNKILGSSVVLLSVVVLAVVGVAGYFGHQLLKNQNEFKNTQEMMLANLRVINEQQIIRDIIEEKIGNKLPADVKSQMSFELYNGCRKYGIRPELVLGLIEQESTWNPFIVNTSSGATGLMQLMYETAIKYYKARGLTLTKESLIDPVLNIAIGIEILADKHEAAMIQGKTSKNDYMYALYYYCGKGDSYAREVMTRTVSYKKRLDSPLQDMLKKRQEEEVTADAVKTVAESKAKKK